MRCTFMSGLVKFLSYATTTQGIEADPAKEKAIVD